MTVINLVLMDNLNRETRKQLVTEEATVADVQTLVTAFLPLWAAVSGLGVQSAEVKFDLTVTPQTPVNPSNIDEGATFNVTTGDGYKTGYKIPGILEAHRLPGGAIDLTDADIIAYFTDFDTGNSRVNANNPTTIDVVNAGVLDK